MNLNYDKDFCIKDIENDKGDYTIGNFTEKEQNIDLFLESELTILYHHNRIIIRELFYNSLYFKNENSDDINKLNMEFEKAMFIDKCCVKGIVLGWKRFDWYKAHHLGWLCDLAYKWFEMELNKVGIDKNTPLLGLKQ